MQVAVDVTLTGPGGGIATRDESDSVTSNTDLYPTFSLRWHEGVV